MAQSASSPPLKDEHTAGATRTQGVQLQGIDVLTERLWRFLTSMKFALALMLVLAALALVGTVLMQMPAGVAASPSARADWLAGVRPRYGGWTDLFGQLQLFTVFTSIWFRVTVVALAISLLACSIQRVPGIWRTATRPMVIVGPAFFEYAPQHESIHTTRPVETLVEAARSVLRRHRYRLVSHSDGSVHIYGDKNRWAPAGSLVGHLSIVVILAGAVVGSAFGFRDGQFMIAEGATATVPGSAGLELRLDAFRDSYYTDTGAPADYASDVVLFDDGVEVARQTVRVNEPLRYGDVSFYQAFYGPAAMMSVTDGSGQTLLDVGVPLAWTADDGVRNMGTFVLPAQDLTVWVVGTSGPSDPVVKPGQMRLEVYQSSGEGRPLAVETVTQGQPAEVAGVTMLFERESQFTGLSVASDPGTPLIWLGGLMLMIGVTAVFVLPNRRLWGLVTAGPGGGSNLAIAAAGRRDSGFDSEFTDIVQEIREAALAPREQ